MANKGQSKEEPSFEQALSQLEQIVASLERGEPELTSALTKYETGVRLLKLSYRLLDEAEQSVALLAGVDSQGEPHTAPFDATATATREVAGSAQTPSSPPPDEPIARKSAGRRSRDVVEPAADDPSGDQGPPF
jgi:exodeoxyribonuclease VII small subunit